MKLIRIHQNVISGQCKGGLLRLQIRYTAIIFFPNLIKGWAGSRAGFFAPRKTDTGYSCTGFYFYPWLAPDIPVSSLPKWYRTLAKIFSFRIM